MVNKKKNLSYSASGIKNLTFFEIRYLSKNKKKSKIGRDVF